MKNIKAKTIILAIIFNVSVTLLKFIFYLFTGSITILAEALHSFSDIFTSILVYFSVKVPRAEKPAVDEKNNFSESKSPKNCLRGKVCTFFRQRPEHAVSLGIGILLFFISICIFRKVIFYTPAEIKNALPTGIIFIIFSFCSYMISKFEINIGKKENSVALISDGMHTKADMIASLLAGFSLIIYYMGLNIDRMVAFCIGLFIFSYSIEVIVNVFAARLKPREYALPYRFIELVSSIFKEETWTPFVAFIDDKLKFGLRKSGFLKFIFKYIRGSVILGALFLYSLTCIYTIGPSSEGIIERFGRPLKSKGGIAPGLHFKFPWPIDKVIKVDSKIIQKINIGNITDENTFALLWTRGHGTEESFISGDNNIFYPYFTLYYRVKDVFKFVYTHRDSRELLDNVANRVISEIFVKKAFYKIITVSRAQIEIDSLKAIQKELDSLASGLEIVALNIKDIHPPVFIAESFEDVIAAYQDKEKMVNDAFGYKNSFIPLSRGKAEKKIRKAEAYVGNKIKRAQGEGARFKARLNAYKINKDISLCRLYLEHIREGLEGNRKVIVEPDRDIPEIWLDFDKALEQLYQEYQ